MSWESIESECRKARCHMEIRNSLFIRVRPAFTERLEIHFVFDSETKSTELIGGLAVNRASLRFRYAVFAKDMRKKVGEIVFGPEEFRQGRWDSL